MSGWTTLVPAETLSIALGRSDLALIDCRFSLLNPGAGELAYQQGHVPGAFYACVPLSIDGPEIEGATASFTTEGTRTMYALNVGTQVPPVGTIIIAHACGGRWTFRYDG